MSDNSSAKCNCGRPIRYSHTSGQCSCNKYEVCPSYDKLAAEHTHYRRLAMMYLATLTSIKDINGCDYEYQAWAKNAIELGESWSE
jgi:hypothetical protein